MHIIFQNWGWNEKSSTEYACKGFSKGSPICFSTRQNAGNDEPDDGKNKPIGKPDEEHSKSPDVLVNYSSSNVIYNKSKNQKIFEAFSLPNI